MDKPKTCAVCFYWEEDANERDKQYGFCHRYPPLAYFRADDIYVYPTVLHHGWCGEFKFQEPPAAEDD